MTIDQLDCWFSRSAWSKPTALAIATFVLILSGGIIIYSISSDEITFNAALWDSWTYIADPGTHAEVALPEVRLVAFFLTIGGMLVFALVIGIIADSLSEQMDFLKKGSSRVIEDGHTLIIGYSDKLVPVIQQIAIANESEGGGIVVVLADLEKQELEEHIASCDFLDLHGTQVVCRSGNPLVVSDLNKVAAKHARSIIILSQQDDGGAVADNSDALAMCSVMSLKGIGAPANGHIVVELADTSNVELIGIVGGSTVETIVAHDMIGRMMIHCAKHPGISQVFSKLLGFDGNEFYYREWPSLVGQTFHDIYFRFPSAIPIGIRNTGSVELIPSGDYVLKAGDEVIVLAEDDDSYEPASLKEFTAVQTTISQLVRFENPQAPKATPVRFLFCGWRKNMDQLITELDESVSNATELLIIANFPVQEQHALLCKQGFDISKLEYVNLTFEQVNTLSPKALSQLELEKFDSIVVFGNDEIDMGTADSQSLGSLLVMRNIIQKRGRHVRRSNDTDFVIEKDSNSVIICEVLDSHTRDLIDVAGISDYVLTNEMISMALSMVSEQRAINTVLSELFSPNGIETHLRPCGCFLKPGTYANFYEVMERAHLQGEIAIGYLKNGCKDPILNPKKSEKILWHKNDAIVAFTT